MRTRVLSVAIVAVMLFAVNWIQAQEWEKYFSGHNYIYTCLEFPGNQSMIGYAAGGHVTWNGNGIVVKTTDGGDTWTSMWTGTNQGIEGMSFPTVNTGYVVGFSGYFGKTTDGGQTWTTIDLGINPAPYVIYEVIFKDENNGIVFPLSDNNVYITNDGGATWTVGGSTPAAVGAGCHVSGDTYFGVGMGRIMRTTDGGLTWTTQFQQHQLVLTGIRFFDDNNGIATGEDGKYFKTTDGGDNWVQHTIAFGYPLWRDVAKIDDQTMYMIGTPEQIWTTTDGGNTWVNDFPQGTGQQAIYEVQLLPNGTLIAGASQGYIFRKQAPASDYPFTEDFEGETFPPAGWSLHSLQAETPNWVAYEWLNHTPGGTKSAFHGSSSEGSVDNWLVTPQISMPAEGHFYLTFWSWLANNWAYKKSSVLVSTGSPNPADEDYVEVWTITDTNAAWSWYQQFVNLQAYAGQSIYIAFRYEGDPWGHTWYIDDIALGEEIDDSPVLELSTMAIEFTVGLNGTGSSTFEVINGGILDLTFDIDVEFLDGADWVSVNPLSGTLGTHASMEIVLSFDADGLDFGSYQANVNLSSNDPENPTATLLVTLEVVDVNVYPFTEDFESETFPPIGWTRYDLDGDGTEWALSWYNHTPGGQFSALHSWSWDLQDGWLVTPQISVPVEGFFYLSFWSFVGDSEFYDKNSVLISTGSGNPNDEDFVEVWTVAEVTENWVQHFIDIEEFAGQDIYIAFRYEGEYAHFWAIDDISLGEEIDVEPVMIVSAEEIEQVVGQDGAGTKSFKVINDGVQNLIYEIEIEYIDAEGWLTVTPESGSIPAKSSNTITLAFDAAGLQLGQYQAEVVVSGNDAENPTHTVLATLTVMEAQAVDFTVIFPEYTFPTAISSDGKYVSGSQFGGLVGYLWTKDEDRIDAPGEFMGVTDNGIVVGTYDSEFTFEGMEVNTAGLWDPNTQEWQFLGMHPDVPEIFGTFYNTGYGVTADGSVVVGMQWYPNWTVRAFKWTEADGYDMIGPVVDYNTRANGISSNGSVIYGWAEPNWTRTPAIWYNDDMIFIDNTQFGEASGSSPSGNYVTGGIGADGFIWSPTDGTTFFQNTLNLGILNPQVVLDDGTVFGYTAEGFPPTPDLRRAFVRHPDGSMETFNEYAASRGWFDAADWIFFSINDVTPDGNVFIGAAELPGGEWISFVVDFNPETPVVTHSLILLVNPENAGTVTGAGDYEEGTTVNVNAVAHEGYQFLNWTDVDGNVVSEVAENAIIITGDLTLIANFILTVSTWDVWEASLRIFPNPASDFMNIMGDDNIRSLELINLTGQKVYSAEINANNYKLDVSALPQGFYMVRLTSLNGDVFSTRILIAR